LRRGEQERWGRTRKEVIHNKEITNDNKTPLTIYYVRKRSQRFKKSVGMRQSHRTLPQSLQKSKSNLFHQATKYDLIVNVQNKMTP
jgi:hypothetical protein